MRNTFSRHERLSSKKLIRTLFDRGMAYKLFPIRVLYLPYEGLESHQVLFTVPRRKFKKAVDRNRIKRQMREAYRLHKHQISYSPDKDVRFLLAYIYIADKKYSYQDIETKIMVSINRLNKVKL